MPNTTNHAVNLPTVGGDFDEWGTENNAAHQAWDTLTSGAQNTVLGRVAASVGPYTQLTAAQLTTIPNAVVGDSGSGGTKGMAPAPASGDAAAGKFLKADGTWAVPVTKGLFNGLSGATIKAAGVTCVRAGTGDYDFTLSPAMPDANYVVLATAITGALLSASVDVSNKTTTTFTIYTFDPSAALVDAAQLSVLIVP